jgi:hypothetical protein
MKIVTAVVNNPDFIEIQYHTLKKYVKGDYEFIVFNDAKTFHDSTNYGDLTIKSQIENMCDKLQIKCIAMPNDHHKHEVDPSVRCADSMNFILQYQKSNPDRYLILDSDMFLIDDLDINTYANHDVGIVLQLKNDKVYFWHGVCYLDFTKLKHSELLNWNCAPGCDTGGMLHNWLTSQCSIDDIRKNAHSDFYYIHHFASCAWDSSWIPENIKHNTNLITFLHSDLRNVDGKFFCELYDNRFLHYRAGCNWRGEGLELHRKLTGMLKDALLS